MKLFNTKLKFILSALTFLTVQASTLSASSLRLLIDKEAFLLSHQEKQVFELEWMNFDSETQEAYAYSFSKQCKVSTKNLSKGQFQLSCEVEASEDLRVVCSPTRNNPHFAYECQSEGDVLQAQIQKHLDLDKQTDLDSSGEGGNPDRRPLDKDADAQEYQAAKEAEKAKSEEQNLGKNEEQAQKQEQVQEEKVEKESSSNSSVENPSLSNMVGNMLWNYAPTILAGAALLGGALCAASPAAVMTTVAGVATLAAVPEARQAAEDVIQIAAPLMRFN